jgi:hypothetical protein
MKLTEQLEARAELARLERIAATATCRELSCDMKSIGGCCACCEEDCSCSVPVHRCSRCGDCDYGDNGEADDIRLNCKMKRELPFEVNESTNG